MMTDTSSTDSGRESSSAHLLTLPDEAAADAAILSLAAACGPERTISPMDVAQALLPAPAEWQRALPVVRRAAVRLALDGRLMIYRKGKPVDPADFRGVYRLGLPQDG